MRFSVLINVGHWYEYFDDDQGERGLTWHRHMLLELDLVVYILFPNLRVHS
jgi:hypothetical protein